MKKTVVCLMIMTVITSTVFFYYSPVFAETFPVAWRHISQTKNNNSIQVVIYASQYGPFDGSVDVSSTETAIQDEIIYINVFIRNNSDDNVMINGLGYKLFLDDPTGLYADYVKIATDYELVRGDFNMVQSGNDGWYWINGNSDFAYEYKPVIPSHTALSATFKLKLPTFTDPGTEAHQVTVRQKAMVSRIQISDYTVSVTDYVPLGSHQDVTNELKDINTTLAYIESLLQDIHDNMGSQDYGDTITESNDLQTTEESVHQQEQQWYADNKTAIEATGLSNYQYSSGLIDSFGVARYQIAMLWNALGDWTYVYYLVFLLGLAVYILRHEPTMRVKQMRADREARMQENQIYTNASRNVRMSRDADYARHVAWGFKTRRR